MSRYLLLNQLQIHVSLIIIFGSFLLFIIFFCLPSLKYVPEAKAYTDPVDTLEEFMNQRRRWINSSWFALDYVLQKSEYYVEESMHSWFTKNITFKFNMLFAHIGKFNTYFIPAFYLFVALLASFQFLTPSYEYKLIEDSAQFLVKDTITCKLLDAKPMNICKEPITESCYTSCPSGFPQ